MTFDQPCCEQLVVRRLIELSRIVIKYKSMLWV